MKKSLPLIALLLAFVLVTGAATQRIVAVGDAHGAYEQLIAILTQTGLIDKTQDWSGGNTIFVQTGDFLDRGSKGRQVMELLMKLEQQTRDSTGEVTVLIGNHEAMNIIGDLRYVTSEEYKNYAGNDSTSRLESAFKQYQEFIQTRKAKIPSATTIAKEEWLNARPPGFLEHREAFSPKGRYGAWIRKRKAIVKVDSFLFLHGGISAGASKIKIDKLNELISKELAAFDDYKQYLIDKKIILPFYTLPEMLAAVEEELSYSRTQKNIPEKHTKILESFASMKDWLINNPEGLLWFRGYSQSTDEELAELLPPQLEFHKVTHIVVGHTVQARGKIRSRQNDGVLLIDTAMLPGYAPEGRPSALEINNGSIKEIYLQN